MVGAGLVDPQDPAEGSRVEQALELPDRRLVEEQVAHHQHLAAGAGLIDQHLGIPGLQRHRFFHQHPQTAAQGLDGQFGVGGGGGGDHQAIGMRQGLLQRRPDRHPGVLLPQQAAGPRLGFGHPGQGPQLMQGPHMVPAPGAGAGHHHLRAHRRTTRPGRQAWPRVALRVSSTSRACSTTKP